VLFRHEENIVSAGDDGKIKFWNFAALE